MSSMIKQSDAPEPVSRQLLASAVAIQSATFHSGRQLANRAKEFEIRVKYSN